MTANCPLLVAFLAEFLSAVGRLCGVNTNVVTLWFVQCGVRSDGAIWPSQPGLLALYVWVRADCWSLKRCLRRLRGVSGPVIMFVCHRRGLNFCRPGYGGR